MNIQKFVSIITGLLLNVIATAQESRQQNKVIKANGITVKKTWCKAFKKNGNADKPYLLAIDSLNSMGFVLNQSAFQENGKVKSQSVFKYKSDSLVTSVITTDRKGKIIHESSSGYNDAGRLNNMTFSDHVDVKDSEVFIEYDDTLHARKNFQMIGGKKMLRDIHYYDNHNYISRDVYYNDAGAVRLEFVYLHDSTYQTIEKFKLVYGSKQFQSKRRYDKQRVLQEEFVAYDRKVILKNSIGKRTFEMGDELKVKYVYDDKGLLITQTEHLNGSEYRELTFEYF